MSRVLSCLYGAVAYTAAVGALLYAVAFVVGLPVPRTLDVGPIGPVTEAVVVNVLLMSLFAVQHSIMARPGFKQWWTRFVPPAIERSTYVLLASLALILLMWQWRPIPAVIWQVNDPSLASAIRVLAFAGFAFALLSTFMINHFELFGLQQVFANTTGRAGEKPLFKTPAFYRFVRHPIYLGFIVLFWATPVMTAGHLLFAATTTAYILIGIALEEHDLIAVFGDEYRSYRQRVGMLLPFWRG